MQACWQSDPGKRPSFSQLSADLRAILKVDDENNGYLNMRNADYAYIGINEIKRIAEHSSKTSISDDDIAELN